MDIVKSKMPKDEEWYKVYDESKGNETGECWLATTADNTGMHSDVYNAGNPNEHNFPGRPRVAQQRTLYILLKGRCEFEFYDYNGDTVMQSFALEAGDGLLFNSRCVHAVKAVEGERKFQALTYYVQKRAPTK